MKSIHLYRRRRGSIIITLIGALVFFVIFFSMYCYKQLQANQQGAQVPAARQPHTATSFPTQKLVSDQHFVGTQKGDASRLGLTQQSSPFLPARDGCDLIDLNCVTHERHWQRPPRVRN
jgi:hypothetical protein